MTVPILEGVKISMTSNNKQHLKSLREESNWWRERSSAAHQNNGRGAKFLWKFQGLQWMIVYLGMLASAIKISSN